MAAHQCPRCELKFLFRTEVEAHLATDHPVVKWTAVEDNSDDPAVDAAAPVDALTAAGSVPR